MSLINVFQIDRVYTISMILICFVIEIVSISLLVGTDETATLSAGDIKDR